MNFLEKVNALLAVEGRTIKYGTMTSETSDPLVTLEVGDSLPSIGHLGDRKEVEYRILIVSVYAESYLAGFDLLEILKSELKSAKKDTTQLVHTGDSASEYDKDKQRYVFKANFKIII